eukprot:TRINITY_DN109_c0_g1_i1.p1 TRINITY_DN109_c0_g1~~TRINITY_DN109_c0_g1_i1.p1  ORF type:complete len:502 (+),score=99.35 TRINITY_DN109_c0_g1_i1:75-1580(+)
MAETTATPSSSAAIVATAAQSKAVAFAIPRVPLKKKPKKILEEEEYVEALESIIERDFYPQLSKLKAQKEYLDAFERNDREAMRLIQARFQSANSSRFSTPASARPSYTPRDSQQAATPTWSEIGQQDAASIDSHVTDEVQPSGSQKDQRVDSSKLSLDQFLTQYTSEDNASFDAIIEATNQRLKEKFERLFGVVKDKSTQLALTNGKDAGVSFALDGWAHDPKNRLMWYPEELPRTAAELIAASKKKVNTINHANTRFKRQPYGTGRSTTHTTSTRGTNVNHGVVLLGDDRAAVFNNPNTGATPQVNGYKLVTTPSPAPGKDMDPTMTWGVVEGEPTLLDDLQHVQGTVFNIPQPSPREQIAHRLADNKAKQRRGPISSSRRSSSVSRRGTGLAGLSPGAQQLYQRLGKQTQSGLNSALRKQYATSHQQLGVRQTPRVTPRGTPSLVTPSLGANIDAKRATPRDVGADGDATAKMPKRQGLENAPSKTGRGESSLTDDLL